MVRRNVPRYGPHRLRRRRRREPGQAARKCRQQGSARTPRLPAETTKVRRAQKGRRLMNKVKEKLKKGEVAYGQMVLELFSAGVGPMLHAAGMEFVLWDMEHGRCDI